MIVGADHLALSCDDVAAAGAVLERYGYRAAFVEDRLPNADVTRGFVAAFHPTHSIAYYEAGAGTPLELTNYGGPVTGRPARYQALVARPPGSEEGDGGPWEAVWRASGVVSPRAVSWPGLGTTVWADAAGDTGEAPAVRTVLCPVPDLPRAAAFWRDGVGCRPTGGGRADDGRAWERLAVAPPFASWALDLVLAEAADPGPARLDDRGFPCVALLCTSLVRDGQRLLAAGATETSGRFEVTVNGRPLAVAFFRAPGGELVELIEFRKDER